MSVDRGGWTGKALNKLCRRGKRLSLKSIVPTEKRRSEYVRDRRGRGGFGERLAFVVLAGVPMSAARRGR
jgi:hypothetical protein